MPDFARAPGARWAEGGGARIAHAVGLALVNQAALIIPLVAIAPVLMGDEDPFQAPPAAFLLLAIIVLLQAGIVVGIGLLRWGRLSLRDLGWRSDDLGRDVGRGIVGFALVAAVVMGLRVVRGGGPAAFDAWQAVLEYSLSQRALFLLIGVVAAFGEESIFRGYLQPSLTKRLGETGGVLMTAAFFSVYHLQWAPLRVLGLFLVGLVYGMLRARDRSLVAPAVAHGLCWAVWGGL
jgi:membrane protease YdiL (CAAX protease family)